MNKFPGKKEGWTVFDIRVLEDWSHYEWKQGTKNLPGDSLAGIGRAGNVVDTAKANRGRHQNGKLGAPVAHERQGLPR